MSSKTNTPSDLTGDIPKKSCPINSQLQAEIPAINTSNQSHLKAPSSPGTDVENAAATRNDDTSRPNADEMTIPKTGYICEESKATVVESSEELKDREKKAIGSDINRNSKDNNTCSTLAPASDSLPISFINKRIAKQFRVSSTNKIHKNMGGKVNKIFFGTVESLLQEKEMWRILYDDGDVDIMSCADIVDAMKYYDLNRKYDTNQAHGKTISPQVFRSEEGNDESGKYAAINPTANPKSKKKNKPNSPKKGKKSIAKLSRKEPLPEWTGPPDEHVDGGWPEGWVKKIFARKNGASKGSTDRYWYSPKEKFKLRSMVQVKKFLKALSETGGDEKKAKTLMLNH